MLWVRGDLPGRLGADPGGSRTATLLRGLLQAGYRVKVQPVLPASVLRWRENVTSVVNRSDYLQVGAGFGVWAGLLGFSGWVGCRFHVRRPPSLPPSLPPSSPLESCGVRLLLASRELRSVPPPPPFHFSPTRLPQSTCPVPSLCPLPPSLPTACQHSPYVRSRCSSPGDLAALMAVAVHQLRRQDGQVPLPPVRGHRHTAHVLGRHQCDQVRRLCGGARCRA